MELPVRVFRVSWELRHCIGEALFRRGGYVLADANPNAACPHCTELLFQRAVC